jgi:hypothetical protein
MEKQNLSQTVNALFKFKKQWPDIHPESKEGAFFILNQFLAKDEPLNAEHLNNRGISAIVGTEIWNLHHRQTIKIPYWFWKKPTIKKVDKELQQYDTIDRYILKNYYQHDIEQDIQKQEELKNSHQTRRIKKKQ